MAEVSRTAPRLSWLLLAGGGLLALAMGTLVCWWTWRPAALGVDDPRITFDTPYMNVRPGVAYVGDEACANCHAAIAEVYSKHSMGRSMEKILATDFGERYTPDASNPFTIGPLRYLVEKNSSRVLHVETVAAGSQPRPRAVEEMHFAVGSGGRARSYLFLREGGYVFQSPITWYPQLKRWDLSPGYEDNNAHFDRPVVAECLFCHANQVVPVAGVLNRYEMPLFRGESIGCERCHGPGGLHVERQIKQDGIDVTIVNPKHLSPVLRDAVCEQCHLEGERRVLRRNRQQFDFRPGLPLHAFMSVFVKTKDQPADMRFVGHVEQLHSSKCFQASAGRMSCTTCHDPHRLAPAAERARAYRQKCLECHASKPCSVPLEQRQAQSAEDSCVQCHMPEGKSEVQHAAVTDHRLLRKPDLVQLARPPAQVRGKVKPLEHYHQEHLDARDPGIGRDYAIALSESIEFEGILALQPADPARREIGQVLLQLVGPAVKRDPEDLELRDAQAIALWAADRLPEAASVYQEILQKAPNRELTLMRAARLAYTRGQLAEAIQLWQQAIKVNPHRWGLHLSLATARGDLDDYHGAMEAAEAALRLHPLSTAARKIMVTNALKTGDVGRAQREFDLLMALDPPDKPTLQSWFQRCLDALRR